MQYRFIGMNMIDPALSNPDLRNADHRRHRRAVDPRRRRRKGATCGPRHSSRRAHRSATGPTRRSTSRISTRRAGWWSWSRRPTATCASRSPTTRSPGPWPRSPRPTSQDAGLTVEIEVLDPATFFVADETNRERQLFYTEYGINYREPSQELVWFTCDQFDIWNYVYFCDEEYDRLFAEAARRARRRRPQRASTSRCRRSGRRRRTPSGSRTRRRSSPLATTCRSRSTRSAPSTTRRWHHNDPRGRSRRAERRSTT